MCDFIFVRFHLLAFHFHFGLRASMALAQVDSSGTGYNVCLIEGCSTGSHDWLSVVLEVGKNRLVTFGQRSIREATYIRMSFAIY